MSMLRITGVDPLLTYIVLDDKNKSVDEVSNNKVVGTKVGAKKTKSKNSIKLFLAKSRLFI